MIFVFLHERASNAALNVQVEWKPTFDAKRKMHQDYTVQRILIIPGEIPTGPTARCFPHQQGVWGGMGISLPHKAFSRQTTGLSSPLHRLGKVHVATVPHGIHIVQQTHAHAHTLFAHRVHSRTCPSGVRGRLGHTVAGRAAPVV